MALAVSAAKFTEMGTDCTPAEPPVPPEFWPLYFAAVDIRLRNLEVKKGELFPYQRKNVARDFLRSLVPNIDRTPLHEVKVLRTLFVSPRAYAEIVERRSTYDQAREILRRRAMEN
jgi:hypothetical protein